MGNKAGGKGKKDPTILTDEDIKTLKLNTQYSEEEIQAWHSGFLKDCPTGKLDKKQFLNVYKVALPRWLDSLVNKENNQPFRDSIPKAKRINTVISSSKRSILITTTGLISPSSCKSTDAVLCGSILCSPFSRLAVGVSQHGNLEDKLKMAFDIYGTVLRSSTTFNFVFV